MPLMLNLFPRSGCVNNSLHHLQPAVLQPAVLQPAVLQSAVLQPAVLQSAVFKPAVLQPAVLQVLRVAHRRPADDVSDQRAGRDVPL